MRARNPQGRRRRRKIFQNRLVAEIGRRVLDYRHDERLRVGRDQSGGGDGRVFRFDPAKQLAAFLRIWRNQTYAARRRKQSHGWWVNDLINVKAERVEPERLEKKSAKGPFAAAGFLPSKDQIVRRIHFAGVVARATE